MSDILTDYREWRQQQEARVSTHSGGCHMWHKDCMIHRLAAALAVEQAKRTLTDAEREAIKAGIEACEDITYGGATDQEAADTLKALLARLG